MILLECTCVYRLTHTWLQIYQINAHNAHVVKHIVDVEDNNVLLMGQLQELDRLQQRAVCENAHLHRQESVLSTRLQVCCKILYSLHLVHEHTACHKTMSTQVQFLRLPNLWARHAWHHHDSRALLHSADQLFCACSDS